MLSYFVNRSAKLSIVFLLIIGIVQIKAFASSKTLPLELNKANHYFVYGPFLELLEDSSQKLSWEQIQGLSFHTSKTQSNHRLFNENTSTYWLRFNVQNNSNINDWIIELPDHSLDQVDIFIPDENNKNVNYSSGDQFNFDKRIYHHKNFIFPLKFSNSQKTKTIYIKLRSHHHSTLAIWIRTDSYFTEYALNEYIILGLFYGICLFMATFNLFLFITNKDKAYLYYTLYVISIAFYSLAITGVGFQYIWYNFPILNAKDMDLSITCCIVWELMYTKSFLDVKRNFPGLNKLVVFLIILRICFFILSCFSPEVFSSSFWLDSITLFIPLIAGIMSLSKGINGTRFYLIGFSFLYLGFLIHILERFGFISNGILPVYSINIGASIEIIFLSFAFADRLKSEKMQKENSQEQLISELLKNDELKNQVLLEINNNSKEKDLLNKKLELLVEEQTAELMNTNLELKKQEEQIKQINKILVVDQQQLSSALKEEEIKRLTHVYPNIEEFYKIYYNDKICLLYLSNLKWDNQFKCKKCNHTEYKDGKELFSRRCQKCNYLESVTANTLFHKLKFPIQKAFGILFIITSEAKEINIKELAEIFELRKNTCSDFSKKIYTRINERKNKKKLKNHTNYWDYLIIN